MSRKNKKQTQKSVQLDFPAVNSGPAVEINEIIGKKWKIYRVSNMHNFDVNKLKRYANKIRDELNASRKFNSHVTYICTVTLNNKLKQNENSTDAIKVEVTTKEAKSIYKAFFISWAKEKENLKDCISLPILLVESKGPEINKIHQSICKLFDCDIQVVMFPYYALVSFFVDVLQSTKNGKDISKDLVYLEYKVPNCKSNDSLKVTLGLQETVIALAVTIGTLREKFEGIKSMEIALEFYNKIMNHIYRVYHMDLMQASLFKVEFPDAFITSDGFIKLSTSEVAVTILNDLHYFTPLDGMICM